MPNPSERELKKILETDSLAIMGAGFFENNSPEKFIFRRIVAFLIDAFIFIFLSIIVYFLVALSFFSITNTNFEKAVSELQYCNGSSFASERLKEDVCVNLVYSLQNIILITILITFGLYLVYKTLLPLTKLNATLGKRLMGLKIVSQISKKMEFIQVIAREIFGILFFITIAISPFLPKVSLYLQSALVGLIVYSAIRVIFNKEGESMADTIAQTRVVNSRKQK